MAKTKSSVVDDVEENELIVAPPEKSELAKVVETLLNDKWKRRKTRLRPRQVSALTTLDTLAQIYDIQFLQSWVEGYTEYLTSEDGKGRSEIVDITKYTLDKEISRQQQMMESLGNRR
jgi:hypothetical protein